MKTVSHFTVQREKTTTKLVEVNNYTLSWVTVAKTLLVAIIHSDA